MWEIKVPLSSLSADVEFDLDQAGLAAGYKLHEFYEQPLTVQARALALYQTKRQAAAVDAYYASLGQNTRREKRQRNNQPIRR